MKLVNLGVTEDDITRNEVGFYSQIDVLFTRFVSWKVFGFKHHTLLGIDDSESWYEVLHGFVEKFVNKNPDMWKLCDIREEDRCDLCESKVKPTESLDLYCLGDEAQTVVLACSICHTKSK